MYLSTTSCMYLPDAVLLLVTVLDWYTDLFPADLVSVLLLPGLDCALLPGLDCALLPVLDWVLVVTVVVDLLTSVTRLFALGDGSGLLSQSLSSDFSELVFDLRRDLNELVKL